MPLTGAGRWLSLRAARHVVGLAGIASIAVGALGIGAEAQEVDVCANHTTFSVLGSATAIREVVTFKDYSIASEVDANLPGAQATIDSIEGSKGWAGAPFVPIVAENAGQASVDANQVPVFAATAYPATPEASNSTPAATVSSKSEERKSAAKAEGGGPGSDQAAAGRSVAAAEASCAPDGGLRAVADSSVDMASIKGVLGIASVRSHAEVVRTADGELVKLEGTIAVEGATVLGQPVSITEKGLVVGSSASPLPDNPLVAALQAAGITVRYVAPTSNRETGEVFAPGLEVTVAQAPPPQFGGPISTTYVFGRALARVALTPGDPVASDDTSGVDAFASDASGSFTTPDAGDALPSSSPGAVPSGAPDRSAGGGGAATSLPTANIGNWSIAPAYSALGVGTFLLVAWVLLEKIAVRFRWR